MATTTTISLTTSTEENLIFVNGLDDNEIIDETEEDSLDYYEAYPSESTEAADSTPKTEKDGANLEVGQQIEPENEKFGRHMYNYDSPNEEDGSDYGGEAYQINLQETELEKVNDKQNGFNAILDTRYDDGDLSYSHDTVDMDKDVKEETTTLTHSVTSSTAKPQASTASNTQELSGATVKSHAKTPDSESHIQQAGQHRVIQVQPIETPTTTIGMWSMKSESICTMGKWHFNVSFYIDNSGF